MIREETKSGKQMFNLKAGNNQVIGTSESTDVEHTAIAIGPTSQIAAVNIVED